MKQTIRSECGSLAIDHSVRTAPADGCCPEKLYADSQGLGLRHILFKSRLMMLTAKQGRLFTVGAKSFGTLSISIRHPQLLQSITGQSLEHSICFLLCGESGKTTKESLTVSFAKTLTCEQYVTRPNVFSILGNGESDEVLRDNWRLSRRQRQRTSNDVTGVHSMVTSGNWTARC